MQPLDQGPRGNGGWKDFFKRLSNTLQNLILEAIGTVAAIGLIALVDIVSRHWLEPDAKFFDYIPVRWVFDLGHLVMILRLIWRIVKGFNEEE
jgi:hypothetical protein